MQFLFSNQWYSTEFIQVVGWTFVHSLWQGVLAAILALVVLGITRKSRPILRYNLLSLLFVFFIAGVIYTFFVQQHGIHRSEYVRISYFSTGRSQALSETIYYLVLEQTKNYFTGFESFFNKNATLIIAIWFFIFCLNFIRLFSGVAYIHRIRHYKTNTASSQWKTCLEQFKGKMGIQKYVELMESAIVKVPLVVGFFNPLILLPIGLLANIPYHQVESILLHELAHIRRRDYLVNLLQNFVETIFFFNPGILWISCLLKKERESCCDEMAMKHLDSKSEYIEALVAFQDYSLGVSGLAMAFPGNKNYLLQRVKRIINNENKKLDSMQKTILFCCILAITGVFILSYQDTKAQKEVLHQINKSGNDQIGSTLDSRDQHIPDTVPLKKASRTRVTTVNNGGSRIVVLEQNDGARELKAKLKGDRLSELFINGKSIDNKEFVNYESEIKSIIKGEQDKTLEAEQKTSAKSDAEPRQTQDKKLSKTGDKPTSKIPEKQQDNTDSETTNQTDTTDNSHQQAEDILAILKKNNIIKVSEGTSIKLSADELLVNGVKQSEELHRLLKQKYIYNPADYFHFLSLAGKMKISVKRVN